MNIPILVLLVVFALIAARKLGRLRVTIWQAMTAGALVVLVTGQIPPGEAWRAIDLDVMLFLFGMFVVGQGMVASGYLYSLAYRLWGRVRSTDMLVLTVLFGGGIASALLMNDTLAIIGTPLALRLAREHRLPPRVLLLALAFAITIGSVMSPIGNPQNLLIAVHAGIESPFVTFLGTLAVPTLVNLVLAYGVLRLLFWKDFHPAPLVHAQVTISDPSLARLARASLIVIVVLIAVKIAVAATVAGGELRLSWIALAGALPLLVLSPRRGRLLRDLDWTMLLFFAAMFVLMASVWRTGYFQGLMAHWQLDVAAVPTVLGVSIALSQLVSNVPLVALYLPLLGHAGAETGTFLALAAGSTIAGNLLILGAASNVIVIQSAERHGATLTFLEFARAGVPLTLLNVLVYWAFLT